MRPYSLQLPLWKFQRLYGSLGTGARFLEAIVSSDRCWDIGNFSKICLTNCKVSRSALAKPRSKLVFMFQRPEKKLEESLELYKGVRLSLAVQSAKRYPQVES